MISKLLFYQSLYCIVKSTLVWSDYLYTKADSVNIGMARVELQHHRKYLCEGWV